MSIPNESYFNYHYPYNMFASATIGIIGLFGVTCNLMMIVVFFKNASEKTSFNVICVTRALTNFYILVTLFLVIFLPTTILGYTPLLPTPVYALLIASGNTFYVGNLNLTLLTALNRFCALFFPVRYFLLCGMKPTIALLILIYGKQLCEIIGELILSLTTRVCWLYFSPLELTWKFTKSNECNPYQNQISTYTLLFLVTLSVNIVTFAKITCFYRMKNDAISRRRERQNIVLFFQTVLQDFLYIVDLSFTFYFSELSDHRLWTFLSGTLIWELVHSIDGFLLIMFNERLAFFKSCLRTSSAPPSLVGAATAERIKIGSSGTVVE